MIFQKHLYYLKSHNILLKKLTFYGIRGVENKWFENYLKNRKQYLEIYETQSDLLDIKCGIPQGSILGPILFLIYINDIGNSNKLIYCISLRTKLHTLNT